MVSLAVRTGLALARLGRTSSRFGLTSRLLRGISGPRIRRVTRAAVSTAGLGAAFEVGAAIATRIPPLSAVVPPRRPTVPHAQVRRAPQPPMRRDVVVTPGPVPVRFVKTWQACAAMFGIDDQGHRWVWRPKLGIWKRIRATRNIVISGKDLRRARRLVSISKRLNKMRAKLR